MSEANRPTAIPQPPQRRRWSGALKLAIAAIFLFLTGGPAVIAQYEENAASYWRQERQRMQRQVATKRPAARSVG